MTTVCGKEVVLPNPKDDRAVFNYIRDWLLKQNKQSKGIFCKDPTSGEKTDIPREMCAYRGNGGTLACAAGCLITDDRYTSDMEGYGIDLLSNAAKLPTVKYFTELGYNKRMISALQTIHDNNPPEKWKRKLEILEDMEFAKDE